MSETLYDAFQGMTPETVEVGTLDQGTYNLCEGGMTPEIVEVGTLNQGTYNLCEGGMTPETREVGTLEQGTYALCEGGMTPEIIEVGTLNQRTYNICEEGNINDDDDLFQCGKCKKQFYSLGTFILHKKTFHLGSFSATHKTLAESLTNDTSNEPDLQLQPIILSESDILSFSIGQAGLNLTSTDQDLHGFADNEALMLSETEGSHLKESREMAGSFELRSTQIIFTTQVTNEQPIEKLLLTNTDSETDSSYALDPSINYLNNDSLIITPNVVEDEGYKRQLELVIKDKCKTRKENKLKCQFCVKEFTRYFDLTQHIRSHTGERPYQCVVCGRSFTQKSNVKKHMVTHKVWPEKIKTLPEKPIQKIPSLNNGETVLVDESFACQYCPATFSSFTQLQTHRRVHVHNKIFKCVQKNCQSVFETLDLFLEHTAAHQKNSDTQYNCRHCKAQFSSLDELGNHQRVPDMCQKKKHSTVVCKTCKSKFTTMEALERHQATDPHSYPCPECGKVFVCERHLRRHLISHNSIARHPCQECGKSFNTAQKLSSHKLVHNSEKPFVCKFCPAKFGRRDRLYRHTFVHDTNRRYKCPFSKHVGCKKEFYRTDKLKAHMLTHSVNKILRCRRCSRVFKRSSQLNQHEAVCLYEDKPCKDCGHVTTSLDHYKKNTTKTKNGRHINRRKHRLLESSKRVDDDVSTIQVVVVPLSGTNSGMLVDTAQS